MLINDGNEESISQKSLSFAMKIYEQSKVYFIYNLETVKKECDVSIYRIELRIKTDYIAEPE